MTLPLKTINGKQYQPVEGLNCSKCALNENGHACEIAPCESECREDGLEVIFIELGDTNEQE